jgi:hypothetical protein
VGRTRITLVRMMWGSSMKQDLDGLVRYHRTDV